MGLVFSLYWWLVIVLFCCLRFRVVGSWCCGFPYLLVFVFVWFTLVYAFVAYCLSVGVFDCVGFVLIVLVLCFFAFKFMDDCAT